MSASLKKCKECGKLFTPKGRENYCSEDHYRPCPVCGKPVIVKYFSDPPRKCDDCKWRKVKPLPSNMSNKSKSLFNIIPEDNKPSGLAQLKAEMDYSDKDVDGSVDPMWIDEVDTHPVNTKDPSAFIEYANNSVMVYIGNTHKNSFVKGHKYVIHVERSDYVYMVTSNEDLTLGETCNALLPIASQISFYQYFGRVKKQSAGKGHTY